MGSLLKRQIALVVSILISFYLTYKAIAYLGVLKRTVFPEIYLLRISICLAGYFFPILGGWYAYRFPGAVFFAFFSSIMVFFAGGVSASPLYIWLLLEYAALCYVLYRTDQRFEDEIAGLSVDKEKYQNEKNDLEIAHKAKGEGISILFEKYSTYYNLRKLAEELAAGLSVSALAQTIVNRSFDFIPRGDLCALSLANQETQNISAIAVRQMAKGEAKTPLRQGDLFDFWVVKNQRRLIVTDAHQDFRFDVKEAARYEGLRSLIIAPLIHQRRVIGTLRINSAQPEVFSNDDLRLLDTIAVVASSALSNAMLFEQTEQLAIKDSLTNLYVRRYFYDRLKEEHRRALLTHRPLSLLMCDLDHFKESNDRFGHAVGDLMLVQFSQTLQKAIENGLVARYGGEEFCVLLPETNKEDAVKIAEKIRETVEKNPFTIRRERIAMTVSIGVANLPEDTLDTEMLVQKSDQALYHAKRQGRNRVCSSVL